MTRARQDAPIRVRKFLPAPTSGSSGLDEGNRCCDRPEEVHVLDEFIRASEAFR
jgi:hypothetical protein